MEAFAWIGEIFQWIARFIPRLEICRATHGGVKFVNGKKVKPITPGLYFYWPLVTEIEIIPTRQQTIDVPPQKLTTKDGKSVLVASVLVYEVDDTVKACADTYDIDKTASDVVSTAAVHAITSRDFDDVLKELTAAVSKDIKRRSWSLLRPFGLKVIDAKVSDFAACQVIVGDGRMFPVANKADEE